jgi:signal transduction histidine kinase
LAIQNEERLVMGTLPLSDPLHADVAAISRLSSVPTILRVISQVTGMRYGCIARVTANQWVACAVHDNVPFGLHPGDELEINTTLCKRVRDTHVPVVIEHASVDPEFATHPTPKMYSFESYVAVPIYLVDGSYFGNVCVWDPEPFQIDRSKVLSMMGLFGQLVAQQLDAEVRQAVTTDQLLDAHSTAELREQFIAVLGHDLRTPLASISLGAQTLALDDLSTDQRKLVDRIGSSARRMRGLVSSLLDLARAKMGPGIELALTEVADLAAPLRHVVAELETSHPGCEIRAAYRLEGPVRCDPDRVSQLLSNLLANALHHGTAGRPIEVDIALSRGALRMMVHNDGVISAKAYARLFQPYSRGSNGSSKGLGLGLYIAREIARAHGGTLAVDSTEAAGTRFTFSLPPPA